MIYGAWFFSLTNECLFSSLYLKASIWHALHHYAYSDAIFLAERLYAEGNPTFQWSIM